MKFCLGAFTNSRPLRNLRDLRGIRRLDGEGSEYRFPREAGEIRRYLRIREYSGVAYEMITELFNKILKRNKCVAKPMRLIYWLSILYITN